jgi:hypothetical protein
MSNNVPVEVLELTNEQLGLICGGAAKNYFAIAYVNQVDIVKSTGSLAKPFAGNGAYNLHTQYENLTPA